MSISGCMRSNTADIRFFIVEIEEFMADSNTENMNKGVIRNDLFGRLDIYATNDLITPENVIAEVNSALIYHLTNMVQEEFLYWYRRNVQPILSRHKDVRPEILNIVQMAIADQVCAFKNGYFLTQPAFYISRKDKSQRKVDRLNEYLYRSGKHQADNKLVDWFHTVGKAALYVEADRSGSVDEPFHAYALDPRSAFVVYSLRPGNEPVMAVNFVVQDKVSRFDVFTKDSIYHLSGGATGEMMTPQKSHNFMATAVTIDSIEPNYLGEIPIIEYRYNSINTSAFELVVPLLDAMNNVASNRIDAVEQFVQSLMVLVNCELPEGATTNQVRDRGLIELKSVGENKADIKILTEQLDQTQTQVLLDDMYSKVMQICAMPLVSEHGTTYDTTGAAVMANAGWYQADAAARNTEDLFKESNRRFDRIIVKLLRDRNLLKIDVTDFELNFVRNEQINIQSKAQAFQTLMAAGFHPELAAAKSGVSNDPVSDIKMSEKYIKMIWGDPDAAVKAEEQGNGQGEAVIVEEDRNNGENETGGAV